MTLHVGLHIPHGKHIKMVISREKTHGMVSFAHVLACTCSNLMIVQNCAAMCAVCAGKVCKVVRVQLTITVCIMSLHNDLCSLSPMCWATAE